MSNFSIKLLSVEFNDMNQREAISAILNRPEHAPFAYVVTPNADHLVRLARNPEDNAFLYKGAWLRFLDSRAVALLARLMGLAVPPVVTGSDLTERLVRHAVSCNESVTVIGMSDDRAKELTFRTGLKFKRYSPPMGFEKDFNEYIRVLEFVENNPSKFVFLAVGSPRQESVAHALSLRCKAKGIGLCIGASLDFMAGAERRAPRWLQAIGMEWLWRLAQNPRRMWRRYLVGCPAVLQLLRREAHSKSKIP